MNSFIPPHVLESLARKDPSVRSALARDLVIRGARQGITLADVAKSCGDPNIIIWDCQNEWTTRVVPADIKSGNEAAQVLKFARFTLDWVEGTLGRNGLDDKGSTVHVSIHFGENFPNAFWDGTDLVFGDGDGEYFMTFSDSIDVMAHEMCHAVVQHTANLEYQGQSGALNEHFADVFGTAVQQAHDGEVAKFNPPPSRPDWLIGDEIMGPKMYGEALRCMAAPGAAYDNEFLGRDPQPAHMRDFKRMTEDNGGVHINSGIPNRLFYIVAHELGVQASARLWYEVLLFLWPTAQFVDFATLLVKSARIMADDGRLPRNAAQVVRASLNEIGL